MKRARLPSLDFRLQWREGFDGYNKFELFTPSTEKSLAKFSKRGCSVWDKQARKVVKILDVNATIFEKTTSHCFAQAFMHDKYVD